MDNVWLKDGDDGERLMRITLLSFAAAMASAPLAQAAKTEPAAQAPAVSASGRAFPLAVSADCTPLANECVARYTPKGAARRVIELISCGFRTGDGQAVVGQVQIGANDITGLVGFMPVISRGPTSWGEYAVFEWPHSFEIGPRQELQVTMSTTGQTQGAICSISGTVK
jgi:hypothetical protein